MKRFFTLALIFSTGLVSQAQLTIDPEASATDIAQILVGQGVVIENVQVLAADSAWGYFNSVGTGLGDTEGLILSTGRVSNAVGPNDMSGLPAIDSEQNCLNCEEFDLGFEGNDLLEILSGQGSADAALFEFDVYPKGDSLKFGFTFASEEYAEWVGSSFNDAFGFFISGPNVGTDVNIALTPGTNDPITINTINNGLANLGPCENCEFYYNNINPLGQDIQYDGYTVGLSAEIGELIPCEKYHLKLIIADGSDRLYDSAVFIEKIDSNPITILTATTGGSQEMIEGCNGGTITFIREEASPDPQDVTYFIGGTATNGVDYTPQLGSGVPNDPITITIPANEQEITIDINPIDDGIDEGSEFITIYLANPLCDNTTLLDSVNFVILDELPIDVSPTLSNFCAGECVDLTAVSLDGNVNYAWQPPAGLNTTSGTDVTACPLVNTTYVVTATLAACSETATAEVNVSDMELTLTPNTLDCESSADGSIVTLVTGGIDPLEYAWTGPNGFTSDQMNLSDLIQGEYCLTVTDAGACVISDCVTVIESNVLDITDISFSDFGCFPISCNGANDGFITIEVDGGTGNYTTTWDTTPVQSGLSATGLTAGTYTVTVVDDGGCEVVQSFTLQEPDELEIQLAGEVDLLCSGASTGLITVSSTGGCAPYFYSWSHDPNLQTPVATDLSSGDYVITVSDVNGCSSLGAITVTINEPQDPVMAVLTNQSVYAGGYNVSCAEASDGTATLDITGGTTPYQVVWQNLDNGDSFFVQSPQNLTCGDYLVTITDGNECEILINTAFTCPPPIVLTYEATPNPCNDPEAGVGAIDITVTGGQGPGYTYSWTGPDGFTESTEDLTGINTGQYCVTVTDELGCTLEDCINLPTSEEIEINPNVVDATCSNDCNGVMSIAPTGGSGSEYSIIWTGFPLSTNMISVSGVCPGSYDVMVADADGCFQTAVIVVNGPDPLVITPTIVEPTCFGNNNGSITIAISGGSGFYSIVWDGFPANNDNLTLPGVGDGSYSVTVNDQFADCSTSLDIVVVAPQAMQIFVEISQFDGGFNTSCNGANDGQINVTINGGTPDCVLYDPYCYQFDWSDGSSVAPNDPNSNLLEDVGPGTYIVNVTDINGCLATTDIPISEPDPLTANAVIEGAGCDGQCIGSIDATPVGGSGNISNINWIGTNEDGLFIEDLCPGTYTLQLTDSNGCESETDYVIPDPIPLEVTLDDATSITCANGSDGSICYIVSGGTGTISYTWLSAGDPLPNQPCISNLPAGTYTLTISDEGGCTVVETVTLEDGPTFEIDLFVPQLEGTPFTIPCNGGTADTLIVNVDGGVMPFITEWTVDGIPAPLFIPEDLEPGEYCVTITDDTGCTAQDCVTITEPPLPFEVSGLVTNVVCAGECTGAIDITVNGGVPDYTFIWRDDSETDIGFAEDISELCAGSYSVVIEDDNGCLQSFFYEVLEPSPLALTFELSDYNGFNISCFGLADGEILITPTGGTPNYAITIDGNTIPSNPVTDLEAGDYTIAVTDMAGCMYEEVVTLMEPDAITFNADVQSISCFGNGDGSIDANIEGGVEPYDISWDNGIADTDEEIQDLNQPATYCIAVIDANGCEATECWEILEPQELTASVTANDPSCGQLNGSIDLDVQGGTDPFNFDWTGENTVNGEEDQTNIGAGDFSVTITDANGCTISLIQTLDGLTPILDNTVITDVTCPDENNGSIDLELEGVPTPVGYAWTDADGNDLGSSEDINDLSGGSYTCTITFGEDACVVDYVYTVNEPITPDVSFETSLYEGGFNVSELNGEDGSITLSIDAFGQGYDVVWSGPVDVSDGTETGINLPAGFYSIDIVFGDNCILTIEIELTQPEEFSLPNAITPNGDGFNDAFVIIGIAFYPSNTFTVYNRWGNKVFEQQNYENTWQGLNSNGDALAEGTYFVVFEVPGDAFETYVDLRR